MTEKRDPEIRALIFELGQSSRAAPSYSELKDILTERVGPGPVRALRPREPRPRWPRWAVGLVAAAVVLLLVGGVAWLVGSLGDESAPAITQTPGPAATLIWSRVPHDEAALGGEGFPSMFDVTSGGPGLVAVGRDMRFGAVWTSPDGLTWSRVPHDEAALGGGGFQEMLSVTSGGPGLVAVGFYETGAPHSADGRVWTSPDGFIWARAPDDEAVFVGEGDQFMESVTAGGPGLVAVGGERPDPHLTDSGPAVDHDVAAVWTSPDGLTWSRVPHEEAVFGGEGDPSMLDVTSGGPGLVAVGSDGTGSAAVWTSPDGITWSRVPHDEAALGGEGFQEMISVTAGGPGLVAVGGQGPFDNADAAVWTSPDGLTWARVPHDEAVFGGEGRQLMISVTSGGPGLVAVGAEGPFDNADAAVWTSPDGLTWSRVPHNEAVFGGEGFQGVRSGGMRSVTAGGPGLVAVGAEGGHGAVWVAAAED